MAKQGLFIVFEGIDGSGKSTYIKLLSQELRNKGHKVHETREQTPGKIGSLIKEYAEKGERHLYPETEALLFAADRTEHQKEINQALEQGKIVISDRYLHSSLAYQGAAGVDLDWIREINFKAREPDMVILLDIAPDSSLRRVRDRSPTVFEETAYLRRVRELYLRFAGEGEMTVVNGDRSIDDVYSDMVKLVDGLLSRVFK